jgi:hypothetical protein
VFNRPIKAVVLAQYTGLNHAILLPPPPPGWMGIKKDPPQAVLERVRKAYQELGLEDPG